MGNLTIRNVDDTVIDRLKALARANGGAAGPSYSRRRLNGLMTQSRSPSSSG